MLERWTAFLLILHLGDDALRLTKVLLMQPFEDNNPSASAAVNAVITLHQEIGHTVYGSCLHGRSWQPYGCGEIHAECFIGNDTLEALDRRLQDMCARCAAQRKTNLVTLDTHCDLVLCASKRETYPLFPCQKRTLR